MKVVKSEMSEITADGMKFLAEIRCDSLEDITPTDPEWLVGSLAAVADEQSVFMLKSDGTWVDMLNGA